MSVLDVGAVTEVEVEAARVATNTHYESAPSYFQAFLDPRMKYSSGLYDDPGATLAEAQTAKLRWVAGLLDLGPGRSLLDVGCGWGSLTLFAAEELGVRVTGITPSTPQAAHIRELARSRGVGDLVDIRVGGFSSDLEVGSGYDAVSFLGSIVHMPDRVAVLAKAAGALRKQGRLYLSESCFRSEEAYRRFNDRPGTKNVTEGTFGFADMVPLSRLVQAIETAGFSLSSLRDLTADYGLTIDAWMRNAEAHREELDGYDGGFQGLMTYLETANAGWGFTTKHYALSATRKR